MKFTKLLLWFLLLSAISNGQNEKDKTLAYIVNNDAFIGHNADRYNNRPLYCNQMPAFIATGDRPHIRLMHKQVICGSFMIGIISDGKGRWLQHFSDRVSMYRPGQMEWHLNDTLFQSIKVILEVVPMESTPGMSIRLNLDGTNENDQIIWAYGGVSVGTSNLNVEYDINLFPEKLNEEFNPVSCKENTIKTEGNKFKILPRASASMTGRHRRHIIAGMCSEDSKMLISDARLWDDIPKLVSGRGYDYPLLVGIIEGDQASKRDIYWAVEDFFDGDDISDKEYTNPGIAYKNSIARIKRITSQVVVNTPDKSFDAAVASACISTDARFYPPVYVHGAMAWNIPFPGWRSLFGPVTFGWHENIIKQAKHYIAYQVEDSDNTEAHADPKLRYTGQSKLSRYYGRGRIDHPDCSFYNFQSQFFDQLCHDWFYTMDTELEKILRPALELHLEWIQECFDPDGNNVYESYINTWATDSQWYNGGESVEETSYAYRGHLTAMRMAEIAGDAVSAGKHRKKADRIKKALIDVLWSEKSGHLGAYREQGGYQRLHEDAWLPGIFLPIDFDMLTREQAVQNLYYSEWGLERNKMPFGGEQCWTSNWVPSKWSVRELNPGDNYHLALAYYKTGLPDMAWELVKGNYLNSTCNNISPGCFGAYWGSDFADISDMFNRVVVEGIFGFSPNYPYGDVGFKPQFPKDWDHASIKTPDFSLAYKNEGIHSIYDLSVSRLARLECTFPVTTDKVSEVLVNGEKAEFRIIPGYGQNYVSVTISKLQYSTSCYKNREADRTHCISKCRSQCH
jgi:hypothetical protein